MVSFVGVQHLAASLARRSKVILRTIMHLIKSIAWCREPFPLDLPAAKIFVTDFGGMQNWLVLFCVFFSWLRLLSISTCIALSCCIQASFNRFGWWWGWWGRGLLQGVCNGWLGWWFSCSANQEDCMESWKQVSLKWLSRYPQDINSQCMNNCKYSVCRYGFTANYLLSISTVVHSNLFL